MQEILQEHLYKRVVVYLDDVFIFSDNEDDHLQDVMAVFRTLHDAGLKTRPDKTQLFREEIKCLGFNITKEGIRPLVKKVDQIKTREVPHTRKGIQSFMGMVVYYRGFVPYLSDKAAPLNDLLKKGRDPGKDWGAEHDQAVAEIKEAFSKAPLLARYDPSKRLLLQTDSSKSALGAV
ncbi:unnamed protein product, partial [Heterosigma akashiwo]